MGCIKSSFGLGLTNNLFRFWTNTSSLKYGANLLYPHFFWWHDKNVFRIKAKLQSIICQSVPIDETNPGLHTKLRTCYVFIPSDKRTQVRVHFQQFITLLFSLDARLILWHAQPWIDQAPDVFGIHLRGIHGAALALSSKDVLKKNIYYTIFIHFLISNVMLKVDRFMSQKTLLSHQIARFFTFFYYCANMNKIATLKQKPKKNTKCKIICSRDRFGDKS